MKSLLLLFCLAFAVTSTAQVAVNTDGTSPEPSAMLEVKSTDKGILVPRMTTAQRSTISSPASGLLVFDNDTQSFWFFSAGAWVELTDQGSLQWMPNGSNISYTAGNVGIGDASPVSSLTVGDGDKFQVNGAQGDLTFTDDEASIQFPATTNPNSPMIYMFNGGTQNADRMVIGHSPAYPKWGIEYHDTTDVIYLRNSTFRVAGFQLSGGVGIGSSAENPHNSAILDVSSTNKGLLPPRMTTAQRDGITSPAAGLVVFNTSENALNVYNGTNWTSLGPVQTIQCGFSFTVNHMVSNGVAPVNKTVIYGTTNGIQGEPAKCWISQNLGADWQAVAVDDATEASAGWYWQFNRMQGYKHDGVTRTPSGWITGIQENSDWTVSNDPCALELGAGWRLPSFTEWNNVDNTCGWINWNGPWNSRLKIHAAGYLTGGGSLSNRGSSGLYWSSTQNSTTFGWVINFNTGNSSMNSLGKITGVPVRCLRDN